MSEYTRTWARDNIGPALAWLALGAHEDVWAMLDYLGMAIARGGDLANSYPADLVFDTPPPEPDWDGLPPLSGRVAAETPSILVAMHSAYARASGDLGPARARFALLRRALLAQGFGPEHLLPFTGDETYRAAMNAAFGLDLEFRHHELSWSANSTLLWLGAAREFEWLARATGHAADAGRASALGAGVERSLQRYVLPGGCIGPLLARDGLAAHPAPFEDVALQVTWAGARDGDDPFARQALGCLLERLRVAPGVVQSPLHARYRGLPPMRARLGVYTGMLPGYTLWALADAGHPEAAAAFDALRLSLDTSGNVQEYLIFDDHSGLSILYDRSGALGDYTAKFRPWEGGILAHAVLEYLAGFRPDAAARRFALRPHLPVGWPSLALRGLRAGGDRFDLEVRRDGAAIGIRVRAHAAAAYTVDLRWDAPGGARPTVRLGDRPIDEGALRRDEHFGAVSVRAGELALPAGGELRVRIEP
jgi:hypothetical protein